MLRLLWRRRGNIGVTEIVFIIGAVIAAAVLLFIIVQYATGDNVVINLD